MLADPGAQREDQCLQRGGQSHRLGAPRSLSAAWDEGDNAGRHPERGGDRPAAAWRRGGAVTWRRGPVPPCTWTVGSATFPTISVQNSFATDGAMRWSSPVTYRRAASRTRARPAITPVCWSASIACTSWKSPIGVPPCVAVAAYETDSSSARCADPTASASIWIRPRAREVIAARYPVLSSPTRAGPEMIQSSPSRVAVVRSPAGSEPAPGSVSANEATSPSARRGSHCCFCASVRNPTRT